MKLRFRTNSVRLRVNQKEVEALARGETLRECVEFPDGSVLAYTLQPVDRNQPEATFQNGEVGVKAPLRLIRQWSAAQEELGLYFHLDTLKVAIEKDLVCVDGPEDERDPYAFERTVKQMC